LSHWTFFLLFFLQINKPTTRGVPRTRAGQAKKRPSTKASNNNNQTGHRFQPCAPRAPALFSAKKPSGLSKKPQKTKQKTKKIKTTTTNNLK
jgi:hypothetical protein